jgi:hypothetical protein
LSCRPFVAVVWRDPRPDPSRQRPLCQRGRAETVRRPSPEWHRRTKTRAGSGEPTATALAARDGAAVARALVLAADCGCVGGAAERPAWSATQVCQCAAAQRGERVCARVDLSPTMAAPRWPLAPGTRGCGSHPGDRSFSSTASAHSLIKSGFCFDACGRLLAVGFAANTGAPRSGARSRGCRVTVSARPAALSCVAPLTVSLLVRAV